MNSTEVQNPRCKLDVFSFVLACAKSDHMFWKHSYSLCGLCLPFVTITLPQTVRLFYVHCVLRLPNSSTLCFPFLRCEDMATVTNSPLHVHYGITLWAYLFRCIDQIYGIALWAYLSEPLIKDSHKHLSSTEKPQFPHVPTHMITHYHYVRVMERYMETLHVKKMADLVDLW